MLELNGFKYSRKSFPDYKIRVIVKFNTINSTTNLDIFTTDTDRDNLEEVLRSRRGENVVALNIIHWTTREQDDRASEFIDEWLKDFK